METVAVETKVAVAIDFKEVQSGTDKYTYTKEEEKECINVRIVMVG